MRVRMRTVRYVRLFKVVDVLKSHNTKTKSTTTTTTHNTVVVLITYSFVLQELDLDTFRKSVSLGPLVSHSEPWTTPKVFLLFQVAAAAPTNHGNANLRGIHNRKIETGRMTRKLMENWLRNPWFVLFVNTTIHPLENQRRPSVLLGIIPDGSKQRDRKFHPTESMMNLTSCPIPRRNAT